MLNYEIINKYEYADPIRSYQMIVESQNESLTLVLHFSSYYLRQIKKLGVVFFKN